MASRPGDCRRIEVLIVLISCLSDLRCIYWPMSSLFDGMARLGGRGGEENNRRVLYRRG